jgi:hypothetical protein
MTRPLTVGPSSDGSDSLLHEAPSLSGAERADLITELLVSLEGPAEDEVEMSRVSQALIDGRVASFWSSLRRRASSTKPVAATRCSRPGEGWCAAQLSTGDEAGCSLARERDARGGRCR